MTTDMQTLQLLEQQLQSVISQRQQYNRQVLEFENAIAELKTTTEAFQIVGSVMIKKDAKTISIDLEKKKEIAEVRLTSITSQEKQLREEITTVQSRVMQELDKE